MKKTKIHSFKFVWRIGVLSVISVVAGIPLIIYALLAIVSLFEITYLNTDKEELFTFLMAMVLIVVTTWIWVTNKWKDWALQTVIAEEKYLLEEKLADKKESLVIKKWIDLDFKSKILRLFAIISLTIGSFYGDHYLNKNNQLLEKNHQFTKVDLSNIRKTYRKKQLEIKADYKFTIDSIDYFDELILSRGYFISQEEKNGFSIQNNDEFKIKYQTDNPLNHIILFDKPSQNTLNRYFDNVFNKLIHLEKDSTYCKCLIDSVYLKFGLNGLAKIYNQETSYWDNENFNKINYRILTQKARYLELQQNCSQIKIDSIININ